MIIQNYTFHVLSDFRITVNTLNNLLVLNFEKVTWDYTLESDKVPPLVQYGSYSDAPVRNQPYAYVRAQRMRKAGASNYKIINRDSPCPESNTTQVLLQHQYRATQLPHSAKSLSMRSMENARRVQSSSIKLYDTLSLPFESSIPDSGRPDYRSTLTDQIMLANKKQVQPPHSQHSAGKSKSRIKSAQSQFSVTIKEQPDEDDSEQNKDFIPTARRISWAFDKPLVPKGKDISLSEMKALLRSQIRMKNESIVPPDFVYLTVSTIQKSFVDCETNYNTKYNMRDVKPPHTSLRKRPNSSPSRIDPRTKVPVEELGLEIFQSEDGTMSEVSDLRSIRSMSRAKEQPKPPQVPMKESFITQYAPTPVRAAQNQGLHSRRVKTTIPQGRVIRPVSAGPLNSEEDTKISYSSKPPRPVTAPVKVRPPTSVRSIPASIAPSLPGAGMLNQRVRPHSISTSNVESNNVPMLMYPKEVREKAEELKEKRKNRQPPMQLGPDGRPLGKVSMYNQPMRDHIKFELRTHQQEEEYTSHVEQMYVNQRNKEEQEEERKKRAAWLAVAKGQKNLDTKKKSITSHDKISTVDE